MLHFYNIVWLCVVVPKSCDSCLHYNIFWMALIFFQNRMTLWCVCFFLHHKIFWLVRLIFFKISWHCEVRFLFTPYDFLVGLIYFAKLYDFVGWCKKSQSRTILLYCKFFWLGCSFVVSCDLFYNRRFMVGLNFCKIIRFFLVV